MLFIDSNIWCYYFDSSSKEHKSVSSFIEKIMGKEEIVMNTVIIMEISHFLIKNLGPIKGKQKIEQMLEFPFIIEDFDYPTLLDSIELFSENSYTGIGGRDSTILATMKKFKIKRLVTHDNAFTKINSLQIIDPVE